MSEKIERLPGEEPLPGTEILAGPRPAPSPDTGKEECEVCGKITWLVIHSCSGVPRTEAAKQRYAEREGFASWADLLSARGVVTTRPVHPRELDKWTRQSQVPGLTVAVDAAGCIVLHTPNGSMTVTSVEGLVNDLRMAVQMRDAMEAPSDADR